MHIDRNEITSVRIALALLPSETFPQLKAVSQTTYFWNHIWTIDGIEVITSETIALGVKPQYTHDPLVPGSWCDKESSAAC